MTGTQIGPFVLLRLLGAGGMGSVYLAEHSLMKDLHAIKILDPHFTQNPQLVTRFVNEARAAARVRHRNLVRVHNIDRMPNDGPWFMVLDYLDGGTLARFMLSHGDPIAPPLILHILAQVANCMQHVHDNKIVHRDLKPENILLIQHGGDPNFPVVLDLGVAQLSEELASGPATKTGTVIGTPIYMAPEQLRGERVSPAADIFALGVIAYEMSTGGYFPYQYDEQRSGYFDLPATEIYYRQRSAPPVDPRGRHAGLGDAWVKALYAALHPDPRMRPDSTRALALMLAAAVSAERGNPDGLSIVHQVARELTQAGSALESRPLSQSERVRTPHDDSRDENRARSGTQGVAALIAGQITMQAPVSTLAGAASESIHRPPSSRPRWGLVAAGALVPLAVIAGVLMAGRPNPPAVATHLDGERPVTRAFDDAPVLATIVVDAGASLPPYRATPRDLGTRAASAVVTADAPAGAAPTVDAGVTESSPAVAAVPIDARLTVGAPGAHAIAADTRSVNSPRSSLPTSASPSAPPPPQAATPKRTGELAIIVRPWAMIWLNGKLRGQTPFREAVAAGRYRLRIANDDARRDETTIITVNPDQTTTIQRSW